MFHTFRSSIASIFRYIHLQNMISHLPVILYTQDNFDMCHLLKVFRMNHNTRTYIRNHPEKPLYKEGITDTFHLQLTFIFHYNNLNHNSFHRLELLYSLYMICMFRQAIKIVFHYIKLRYNPCYLHWEMYKMDNFSRYHLQVTFVYCYKNQVRMLSYLLIHMYLKLANRVHKIHNFRFHSI